MPAGYHYDAKLRIASAGLSPASTAASLAAPVRRIFPGTASSIRRLTVQHRAFRSIAEVKADPAMPPIGYCVYSALRRRHHRLIFRHCVRKRRLRSRHLSPEVLAPTGLCCPGHQRLATSSASQENSVPFPGSAGYTNPQVHAPKPSATAIRRHVSASSENHTWRSAAMLPETRTADSRTESSAKCAYLAVVSTCV